MVSFRAMRATDSERAGAASMLLVVAFGLDLGLMVLGYAVRFVKPDLMSRPLFLIEELAWLVIAMVVIVGLLQLASLVTEKSLAVVTAIAWVGMALMDLASALTLHLATSFDGDPSRFHLPSEISTLIFDLSTLVSLAARGVLFFFFIRVTLKTSAWVLPVLATTYLFSLVRNGMYLVVNHSGGSGYELYKSDAWRYGSMIAGLLSAIALLASAIAVHQTLKGQAPGLEQPRQGELTGQGVVATPPAAPGMDFLVGGILLLVGVVVTVISMEAASSGGRYVVATGAIGVGLGRIIRGFIRLAKSR